MSIPRVKQKTQQSPSVTVGTRRSDCFTFFPREKKTGETEEDKATFRQETRLQEILSYFSKWGHKK